MTYLWIHHSKRFETTKIGTTSSHSHVAPSRREMQNAMTERPTAYITPTWTRPLYIGWICAWYSSRNCFWRSDIMATGLLAAFTGLTLIYQAYISSYHRPGGA